MGRSGRLDPDTHYQQLVRWQRLLTQAGQGMFSVSAVTCWQYLDRITEGSWFVSLLFSENAPGVVLLFCAIVLGRNCHRAVGGVEPESRGVLSLVF